jgi:hypothetical protein
MKNTDIILNKLTKEFPNHNFRFDRRFDKTDFCPKFLLVIDDKKSDIIFNPEMVDDFFVAFEGSKLGLDPLDPLNLMIPITPEKIAPILEEISAIYVDEVKRYF